MNDNVTPLQRTDFEVGDTVKLAGHNLLMTVTKIAKSAKSSVIFTSWYAESYELLIGEFDPNSLILDRKKADIT